MCFSACLLQPSHRTTEVLFYAAEPKCCSMLQNNTKNNCGTVHIVAGDGGNLEGLCIPPPLSPSPSSLFSIGYQCMPQTLWLYHYPALQSWLLISKIILICQLNFTYLYLETLSLLSGNDSGATAPGSRSPELDYSGSDLKLTVFADTTFIDEPSSTNVSNCPKPGAAVSP